VVDGSEELGWEVRTQRGGAMMGEQNGTGENSLGNGGSGAEGVGDSGELVKSGGYTARLPKIIPFRELCRCGDEVWIENEGQLYRLRRTKQGKLILTK